MWQPRHEYSRFANKPPESNVYAQYYQLVLYALELGVQISSKK